MRKESLLYPDPAGNLAPEILETPELFVQGRYVYAKGLGHPLAHGPEDLDSSLDPGMVTPWARYDLVRSWTTRPPFKHPTRIVLEDTLQAAKHPSVISKHLDIAMQALVPQGVYVARLTEVGGKGLPAAPIRHMLVRQFGPPAHQYRIVYPSQDNPSIPATDWIGVWKNTNGKGRRG